MSESHGLALHQDLAHKAIGNHAQSGLGQAGSNG